MHSILALAVQWSSNPFFDHCASSGVVSEMLASGKYPVCVPEALKFAFMLEAMVGDALEVLSQSLIVISDLFQLCN
jgi:hypothetical protein